MCDNATVPATDDVAKAWELDLAERFGRAVRERRAALGLSAQQVSDRTRGFGYPVTRVAISKIEGNTRSGKIDVAELLTLALALEIPPPLLLFPDFPDGEVEVVPGKRAENTAALRWLAGRRAWQLGPENTGTQLVEAAVRLEQLEDPWFEHQLLEQTKAASGEESEDRRRVVEEVIETRRAGRAAMIRQIERAKARLWGRGDA